MSWLNAVLGILVTLYCAGNTQAQDDVDVVFIVDGSGSVGAINFRDVFLPLIQQIGDDLLTSSRYRVGFVLFGNEGVVEFDLDDVSTSAELQTALAAIEYESENTNTTGGIRVARLELFMDEDAGGRADADKVAILLTDGPVTRDADTLSEEVQASRAAGIDTYVIAVANPDETPLNMDHLLAIASEPVEEHMTIYQGFNSLLDDSDDLAERLVEAIQGEAGEETSTTLEPSTATTQAPSTTTTLAPSTTTTTQPVPETTTPVLPETTSSMRPETTTSRAPQVSEWACRFETGSGGPDGCDLQMDGDFKWQLRVGRTATSGTGPSAANTGRVYMYMESSRPRRMDDEAMFYIPKRVFDGPQCLSFAAHMYGDDVGSLEVIRMTSAGDEDVLYTQTGPTSSDEWFTEEISSNVSADDMGLVIRGTIGGGKQGDIAVDTIRVTAGSC